MATITYLYSITDTVFHMDAAKGVREAVVRSVAINIAQPGTTKLYDIAFSKPTEGSAIVTEVTLYPDVDAALLAYKSTVLV